MFDFKSVNIKTSASTPLITKGVFHKTEAKSSVLCLLSFNWNACHLKFDFPIEYENTQQ